MHDGAWSGARSEFLLDKPEIAAVLEWSTKLIHLCDHKPGAVAQRKCVS
jgi:hypothetical protein